MPPGTFRIKLNVTDWLLYACGEIARLTKREKILDRLKMLRKRLKYGVKMELLPLIRIRNVGRVRARRLFDAGFKNVEDIKKGRPEFLVTLLGKKVAGKVMEQLGMEVQTTL
jgi:helicase